MKKNCVIFGGSSTEHDISIITGMQLAKQINEKIEKIYLGIDNKFYLASKICDLKFFTQKEKIKLKEVIFSDGALFSKGNFLKKLFEVDCVINCCHGGVGENGDLAGFFAVNKIRCTSPNSLAAHIAMDKTLCKKLVGNFANVVKGTLVNKNNMEEKIKQIQNEFANNLIIKPNSLGSSIGVKACDKSNFQEQIEAIFELKDKALVEERVVNMVEYNQACLRVSNALVLSAIEQPLSKNDFLTFEDKYKSQSKTKGRDRIIPAKIDKSLEDEISELTKRIYEELGMSGVVRVDYIYDTSTKTLYFNEINTIPGSMAFYLFEPEGVDYITLINQLVDNAPQVQEFAYFLTEILENKKI